MKLSKNQIIEQEQDMAAFLKAREESQTQNEDESADWEAETGGDWDSWGA